MFKEDVSLAQSYLSSRIFQKKRIKPSFIIVFINLPLTYLDEVQISSLYYRSCSAVHPSSIKILDFEIKQKLKCLSLSTSFIWNTIYIL